MSKAPDSVSGRQVDITNNNNNPQTACRHSRNSSETTNPTTSASDDLSCSPDHPLDDHSKQSTDDDYDSEPDQPDGHQCNRCPDDTRNEAAADRRSTGPLSPSDSAAATTDLQPPAPPCRKRRGAQQQQQQLDGVSSPSGSFRDSASSINDSAAKAGAWTNGSQDSTGSRLVESSCSECYYLLLCC